LVGPRVNLLYIIYPNISNATNYLKSIEHIYKLVYTLFFINPSFVRDFQRRSYSTILNLVVAISHSKSYAALSRKKHLQLFIAGLLGQQIFEEKKTNNTKKSYLEYLSFFNIFTRWYNQQHTYLELFQTVCSKLHSKQTPREWKHKKSIGNLKKPKL